MTILSLISVVALLVGAGILVYVYWGYGAILRLVRRGCRETKCAALSPSLPRITVLLTVYNEEHIIEARLQNLLEQEYPSDRFEILVCSDGSDDKTEQIAAGFAERRPVRIVKTSRVGKSAAQNVAVPHANGDIVVLTDAETLFDKLFLRAMAECFSDERVGCATAYLLFVKRSGSIAENQSRYWRYELSLREAESRLGILAVASGQAMAFRRELFRPLSPFVGDDCIIPLDVIAQGRSVVHCPEALAYDLMENEGGREFRTRIRMTMRNWTGTWRYPELLNPFRYPGYAFALWSHKLLRWLGWVGILLMLFGALGMLGTDTMEPAAILFLLIFAAGGVGWWAEERGITLPFANTIYTFLLANIAFMVGVIRAMAGARIAAYRAGHLKAH